MEGKCVNCRKIKPVFQKFEGTVKKFWCGNGHYITRTRYWCRECWEDYVARENATRLRQETELASKVAAIKAQLTNQHTK